MKAKFKVKDDCKVLRLIIENITFYRRLPTGYLLIAYMNSIATYIPVSLKNVLPIQRIFGLYTCKYQM